MIKSIPPLAGHRSTDNDCSRITFFRQAIYRLSTRFLASLVLIGGSFAPTLSAQDLLPPEQAFALQSTRATLHPQYGAAIEVQFAVAPKYYLYQKRFQFRLPIPDQATHFTLGEPQFPAALTIDDPTFGPDIKVFREQVTFWLPLKFDAAGDAIFAQPLALELIAQGCADIGVCYPPHTYNATVDIAPLKVAATAKNATALTSKAAQVTTDDSLFSGFSLSPSTTLASENYLWIFILFLLLGVGLSLTPCVLPMVPIVSSLIIGEQKQRSGVLTLAYTLGVIVTYTTIGVIAGALGVGLASALQNPWVLGAFALLLLYMAITLWLGRGFHLPQFISRSFTQSGNASLSRALSNAFLLGILAALVVGPCVAPPLAAILLFISQSQQLFLGGLALAALALGMCVPLLLIGFSAKHWLPKSGPWMTTVNQIFAILLLALAIWLLAPLMQPVLQMSLFAALGLLAAAYFLWRRYWLIAIVFALLGALQAWGAATNAIGPLAPLTPHLKWERVADLKAFNAQRQQSQLLMLDFYADWCISCKEMEAYTFSEQRVQQALAGIKLLQADVTANSAADNELLREFSLFGPPATIFFDTNGNEVARVIGYQNADQFLQTIQIARQVKSPQ